MIVPILKEQLNSLPEPTAQQLEDQWTATVNSGSGLLSLGFTTKPCQSKMGSLDLFDDSDDEILDMDEEETMNAPLQLITKDIAMKVQSDLLRDNLPAVQLVPYKYMSYD